jgi:glutaredoxin-like protein DUF836
VSHGPELLSRPDCPLCDEFLEELAHAFPDLAAGVRIVDVDSREDWRQLYGRRIPVLLAADGSVLGEGLFDAAALAARLGRPARG